MTENLSTAEQNEQIHQTVQKERRRLLDFVRKRVPTEEDAEDLLQEVFFELIETYRLMKPVEQLASWLFKVARNKITDFYRKKKTDSLEAQFGTMSQDDGEKLLLQEILPADIASVNDEMMYDMILGAISEALEELPEEQRNVFEWHEFDGKSFKTIAEETGISVNTLISRKHYAVNHLRERLRYLYQEMFN
ncbi:RNA polymerase sigma factor, sigma-70 family [Pseudarcicella hirudinis]|uniref:RNA polymerase sigma factor, sigma-70 family n=2 Tax=Pseudarcicella hirudinis TaxID=1079859 RepID=A0A1I5PDD8_9BACT|nr:sigma-70 family RNA polymerase sigma factor [Pseudarcicella hirudinis]SFP32112.1 RNA polymerase sigma factor, sigma-70 family [Pseudarcicella hirudinis]